MKPRMNCSVFRDSVTDYLEKDLTPSMSFLMVHHREDCSSCQAFENEIVLTVEVLGALGECRDKSDYLVPQIIEKLKGYSPRLQARKSDNPRHQLATLVEMQKDEISLALSEANKDNLRQLGTVALDYALKMGVKDPAVALKAAHIGVSAEESLRSAGVSQTRGPSRLAEAWAVLANCRRISSDFWGAQEAFRVAEGYLDDDLDQLARARVLQLKSTFQSESGRSNDALASIEEAISIYRSQGTPHQVGRAMITKGTILGPVGDSSDAVQVLTDGLSLVDEAEEPRLVLVGKHNLVHSLVECSRFEEALEVLGEIRVLHEDLGNELDQVRLRWLEASLKLEVGELSQAEEELVAVRRYFIQLDMLYDVALVSLDLAMVYLKQARVGEVKNLASEMVTVFQALGVKREVLAAMTFFNKALEIEHSAALQVLQECLEKVRSEEDFRHHLTVAN